MLEQKKDRNGEPDASVQALSPALAAQALRLAHTPVAEPPAPKSEDRLTLFWRLFGGALVSVGALVAVTAYQQLNSSLTELRTAITHLNETHADMVKKDEFNTRMTTLWNGVKESNASAASVTALRERAQLLEQQLKTAEDERKELVRELQQLRERLVVVESQQRAAAKPAGPRGQAEKP